MAIEILMPALSPTMEEGKLASWLVKEGDEISSGDVLCEIETDKATMEVESIDEGIVGKILVEEGTEGVLVNTVIAVLLVDGEDASAMDNIKSSAPVVAAPEAAEVAVAAPAVIGVVEAPVLVVPQNDEIPEGTTFKQQTIREALRDAMAEEMRKEQKVFVMGEEVAEYQGAYKVTQGLLEEFGKKRVIDTPITEHGFAGIGVGAAFGGLKPIVEFMTFNFAMQAIDHIINSAAKTLYMSGGQMGCPIVFRGPNGAASRVGAQHSQDYTAWYANIPGLKVVSPYSAEDAKGLLKAAILDPNPVIFLENELLYGLTMDVPEIEDFVLPIGKAKIERAGSDVTIVSHSMGVKLSLEAAEILAEQGISAEVVNLRTIRPLDTEAIINSVKKTGRMVTVEEGWVRCGLGAELAAVVMDGAFDYLDAPVARVTSKDVPLPYAANLEKLALPNANDIVAAARKTCYAD
ncbi:MAG: pyruvate dehydrogenase complex E1 component subunit beta [Rhizobiales bacterium]|nr:pyruvate dehydrogenase complex E1 component subunit beta [Hyphomicrobiales bacterium]